MFMIINFVKFDVIVMENFFGDILFDELSVLFGIFGVMLLVSYFENGLSFYEFIYGLVFDIVG